MTRTVVKIDLCRSKEFAKAREHLDSAARKTALEKLSAISSRFFPEGDTRFPDGSFYNPAGDAVIYIVEKSSIAVRGAIEFMQAWCYEGLPDCPDCRVFLQRGEIVTAQVAGTTDLVGRPFEDISVFEKSTDEGRIYLTQAVLDTCDRTMAKFVFYRDYESGVETLRVYFVDFLNPRTIQDNSLVHALFVANKEAAEARERLFELFLVEYLLESQEISDTRKLLEWAREKNYPMPRREKLEELLCKSQLISRTTRDGKVFYGIPAEKLTLIKEAQEDFRRAREECIEQVSTCIIERTRSEEALKGIDLPRVTEEYLCAVFSEIRMMANYFRDTFHLFEAGPETFQRFDYVLKRHLPAFEKKYFDEWKDGFLRGLKTACGQNNPYIAAVFHNVLATYYLNRSSQAGSYQEDKLKQRQIFMDTNVLYSLMVPASSFHELTTHFTERLHKIGLRLRVYPFTVQEYEHSLSRVVNEYTRKGICAHLLK